MTSCRVVSRANSIMFRNVEAAGRTSEMVITVDIF